MSTDPLRDLVTTMMDSYHDYYDDEQINDMLDLINREKQKAYEEGWDKAVEHNLEASPTYAFNLGRRVGAKAMAEKVKNEVMIEVYAPGYSIGYGYEYVGDSNGDRIDEALADLLSPPLDA